MVYALKKKRLVSLVPENYLIWVFSTKVLQKLLLLVSNV